MQHGLQRPSDLGSSLLRGGSLKSPAMMAGSGVYGADRIGGGYLPGSELMALGSGLGNGGDMWGHASMAHQPAVRPARGRQGGARGGRRSSTGSRPRNGRRGGSRSGRPGRKRGGESLSSSEVEEDSEPEEPDDLEATDDEELSYASAGTSSEEAAEDEPSVSGESESLASLARKRRSSLGAPPLSSAPLPSPSSIIPPPPPPLSGTTGLAPLYPSHLQQQQQRQQLPQLSRPKRHLSVPLVPVPNCTPGALSAPPVPPVVVMRY
jgi:hypothetical protein